MSTPTDFAWRLQGPPGPALTEALAFNEAVRAAVMRAGNGIGLARLPDALHGPDPGAPHTHAFWLAEDQDADGHIDHVVVHAEAGLTGPMIAALALAGRVWLGPEAEWILVPAWLGRGLGGLWGPARLWRTTTPYVTPLWRTDGRGRLRASLAPDAQLRREIALRGLPDPSRIVCSDPPPGTPVPFHRDGRTRRPPGDAWAGAALLVFDRPVRGPLAFGFGAHFGLGLFRPVRAPAAETLPGKTAEHRPG